MTPTSGWKRSTAPARWRGRTHRARDAGALRRPPHGGGHGPAGSDPRPSGQHPHRHAPGGRPVQLLARRHQSARPVAAHHPRFVPERRAGLGGGARPRCTGGAEGEDWVWKGAAVLPGTHDRAILSLSRGGGDAVVLREFDLPSRSFLAGGFALSEAKGGAAWFDRDTLILSSAWARAWRPGRATRARSGCGGAARRRWRPR